MTIANYTTRLNYINSISNFQWNHILRRVDTKVALDFDDALKMHKNNLKLGYEGSIYRSFEGKYKGTRSWDLMKFKDFHDAEATIIDFVAGKGKREGTLGKFIMQDHEGVIFGCPPGKGYNYAALAEMLENAAQYVGQWATFTYFERTKAGSYRHPHYKCLRNYE
jgi:DNA ligase-1